MDRPKREIHTPKRFKDEDELPISKQRRKNAARREAPMSEQPRKRRRSTSKSIQSASAGRTKSPGFNDSLATPTRQNKKLRTNHVREHTSPISPFSKPKSGRRQVWRRDAQVERPGHDIFGEKLVDASSEDGRGPEFVEGVRRAGLLSPKSQNLVGGPYTPGEPRTYGPFSPLQPPKPPPEDGTEPAEGEAAIQEEPTENDSTLVEPNDSEPASLSNEPLSPVRNIGVPQMVRDPIHISQGSPAEVAQSAGTKTTKLVASVATPTRLVARMKFDHSLAKASSGSVLNPLIFGNHQHLSPNHGRLPSIFDMVPSLTHLPSSHNSRDISLSPSRIPKASAIHADDVFSGPRLGSGSLKLPSFIPKEIEVGYKWSPYQKAVAVDKELVDVPDEDDYLTSINFSSPTGAEDLDARVGKRGLD